jgi:hypothetical protein
MPTATDPTERSTAEASRPLHLRRIDVRAALIVGGVFSAVLGLVFLVTGWFVVAVAAQRGVLDQINSVSNDLSSGRPTHLGVRQLCLVWMAIVVGWTVAMTAVIGLAATIFNAVLRLVGGIELDLSPTAPARPEVFTEARHKLGSVAARVQAQSAKRLRQIDWSMLNLPGLAKPAHDGVDVRRSNAARARSVVHDSESDEETTTSG